MKKYMVVEHYKANCYEKIYKRVAEQGRMLPDGCYYLNSWVNKEKNICFQLMETDNKLLFEEWIEKWKDLIDFEVYSID